MVNSVSITTDLQRLSAELDSELEGELMFRFDPNFITMLHEVFEVENLVDLILKYNVSR